MNHIYTIKEKNRQLWCGDPPTITTCHESGVGGLGPRSSMMMGNLAINFIWHMASRAEDNSMTSIWAIVRASPIIQHSMGSVL